MIHDFLDGKVIDSDFRYKSENLMTTLIVD